MLVGSHMQRGALLARPRQQQQQQRRGGRAILCRHDTRKSANNAEDRRQQRPRSLHEQLLDPQLQLQAQSSMAYRRASALCGATSGQLSLQLCLFLFTEQPQLLGLGAQVLAGRISALAEVTGLSPPDAAELVARNAAVLDVLPLRLNAAAEALALALSLSKAQALVMLASDQSLLNVPALRVRQQLDALAPLLGQPPGLLAQLVAGCPQLLRVEGSAVQIRWSNLSGLLGLHPASPELQQLVQQEPRLLMPSSSTLSDNHAAICAELRIRPSLLNSWLRAAPMLLLVPAAKLRKRLRGLLSVLSCLRHELGVPLLAPGGVPAGRSSEEHEASVGVDGRLPVTTNDDNDAGDVGSPHDIVDDADRITSSSSRGGSGELGRDFTSSSGLSSIRDLSEAAPAAAWNCQLQRPDQVLAFISKDPRLLLLSPGELLGRLQAVQQELQCRLQLLLWLALCHPSYLVVEPGLVSGWAADVRHLTQMSSKQVNNLAVCPQVFLTMTPEEVLLAVNSLSSGLQLPYPSALHMAAQAPLLLVQHPAATAAAAQQLQKLVTDPRSLKQLLLELPELLLLGARAWQVVQDTATALSLSAAQLAALLTRDASLWHVMVPRATWSQQQQQQEQQGQQQRSPGLAAVAASMAAVTGCGLRPPAVMQQAAILQPGLLQLSPQALQQQVQQLMAICSRSEGWQQQLQFGLPPELLGKAILKMPGWRLFLEFFVSTGLSRIVTLQDVVDMRRADFTKTFHSEYLDWQQLRHVQRQRQQQQEWQQEEWQQQQQDGLSWPLPPQEQEQQQEEWQQQFQHQHWPFANLTEEQRLPLHRRWLLGRKLPRPAAAGQPEMPQQQQAKQQQQQGFVPQHQASASLWQQQEQQQEHGWDLLVQGVQALSSNGAAGVAVAQPVTHAAVGSHHHSSSSSRGLLEFQRQQQRPLQQQHDDPPGQVIYLDDDAGSYEVVEPRTSSSSSSFAGTAGTRGNADSGAASLTAGHGPAGAATDTGGSCSSSSSGGAQQQRERRHVRARGYGPAATRAELALQAVQWSAFEMYGCWHGCLVQPAGDDGGGGGGITDR